LIALMIDVRHPFRDNGRYPPPQQGDIDVRPVPDGKGEPSKPVTSAEVTGDQKDLSSDLWDPKTFACLTHRPSTALRRRWFVGSLRLTECVTSSRCQTPASLLRKLTNSSKTADPRAPLPDP